MNILQPLMPNPAAIAVHRRLGKALPRRVMRIKDAPDPIEALEEVKAVAFSAYAQRRILGLMSDGKLRGKREVMAWTGLHPTTVAKELARLIREGRMINYAKLGSKGQYQMVGS